MADDPTGSVIGVRTQPDARDVLGARVPRTPGAVQQSFWTLYLLGVGAFLLALTWDDHGTSRRRLDPVDASIVTERHLDRAGWILASVIVVVALVCAVLPWRWHAFVDTAGATRVRPRSRLDIAWADVTAVRIVVRPREWLLRIDSASDHVTARLPYFRRADRVIAIQRALDVAGHGVEVRLPGDGRGALVSMRQFVYDVEVATGRRPATEPRPHLTRRDVRIALLVTLVLAALVVPTTWWIVSRIEPRSEAQPAPLTPVDLDALSGTREPDLSTLDGVARATAVRALANLTGATASIDCDGPIPTEGGLPTVRYVSVRTASGLWESTPEFPPYAIGTSWRLADLVSSGVFATTGPLPDPVLRWEVKVDTDAGPAWFGCTPVR